MRYIDLMAAQAFMSDKVREAVKLSHVRAQDLASKAGMSPSMLSLLINRQRKARTNDPRIIKLGRILKLGKGDIFERQP